MKKVIKRVVQGFSSLLTYPLALISAFGRFPAVYEAMTQLLSLLPGLPGDYLREGFYSWVMANWGDRTRVRFGSIFTKPGIYVGDKVSIGTYCRFGYVRIGDRTRIASGAQLLSGRHHHKRDSQGQLQNASSQDFSVVTVGSDCWIGAGAIVMADVGDGSTVGAGAVVVKPVNPGTTVVGNPAKPLSVARP